MSEYEAREEAREKLTSLTPQQRLENLEYLTFRLFMQSTELPPVVEDSPIVTVEDLDTPPRPPMPAVNVPYDLAYARAGAEQILQQVGGDVSIPHLLHAIRAQVEKFNVEARAALEKEKKRDGPEMVH